MDYTDLSLVQSEETRQYFNDCIKLIQKGKSEEVKALLKFGLFTTEIDYNRKGILIVGANPSGEETADGTSYSKTIDELLSPDEKGKRHRFWSHIYNLLNPELLNQANYMDIFPMRLQDMETFLRSMNKKDYIKIQSELLMLAYQRIEKLQPKLIVLRFSGVRHLFGTDAKHPWLGFNINYGKEMDSPYGPLYHDVIPQELRAGDNVILKENKLTGTHILFDCNMDKHQLSHQKIMYYISKC